MNLNGEQKLKKVATSVGSEEIKKRLGCLRKDILKLF